MEGLIGIKTKKKISIILIIIVAILAALGGMTAYQATHFNKGVSINGVDVGGLTAKQAISKLKGSKLNNTVYIGNKVLYQGEQTASQFSSNDKATVKQILKKQFTLIPINKKQSFSTNSKKDSTYRKNQLRAAVYESLKQQNETCQPVQDAYAILKDGKVSVVKEKTGDQYDINAMMKEYDQQINNDKIVLKAVIAKPVSSSSKQVKTQETKLEKLSQATVDYKVENQTYKLAAKDMIKSAKYINGKYQINAQPLKEKIKQINQEKATLNKEFNFKTSTGKEIQVQGKTYGWAIDTSSAVSSILKAYENGTQTVDAKNNIYGVGYNENGTGYGVTSNDGIGDTYAELSLADQHAWFYRDGKLVAEVDVVTGDVKTKCETPTGVYYIMYKQSPSVLKGTHPGGEKYEVDVDYWAQFTNDGCGFHDASWRTNWDKDAYLTDGSNGCANIKPAEMEKVYNALSANEPVIIY